MRREAIKKSVISLVTAVTVAAPVTSFAAVADFPDMTNDWSRPALVRAVNAVLLQGIDGKIAAEATLTRAQISAILVRAFGAEKMADMSAYSDVPADAWYANELAKAVEMGIIKDNNGMMNPKGVVSRQEAATIFAAAFALELA